jgi:hypothetical protein
MVFLGELLDQENRIVRAFRNYYFTVFTQELVDHRDCNEGVLAVVFDEKNSHTRFGREAATIRLHKISPSGRKFLYKEHGLFTARLPNFNPRANLIVNASPPKISFQTSRSWILSGAAIYKLSKIDVKKH